MCPLDVSMHWTVTMSIQNYANEMPRYYRFISYHVIIRLSINREQLKYTNPCLMLYILALPCPRLYAPRNGTIVGCDVQPMYGTQCRFACNEGFVLKRGSSRRTCELSSLETRVYWTGSPPVCISKYLY